MGLPVDDDEPHDFDFIIGDWRVRHRRLKERLCGCAEWEEFEGLSSTSKTLGGFGNIEDNLISLPDGPYRAAAFRSYDASAGAWSIWWLDSRIPGVLDTPVVGRFDDGVGVFFADDTLRGRPIRIRFTWHSNAGGQPRWDQAFSDDAGATWESNWQMEFARLT